jgi:hypothetical protein
MRYPVSDELDPLLLELFEAKRTALNDPEFIAALLERIKRQQRAAYRRQLLLAVVFLSVAAWQLPGLLRATASAVQTLSVHSQTYAPLLISPMGWVLSMLVGLAVMVRIMPRRL